MKSISGFISSLRHARCAALGLGLLSVGMASSQAGAVTLFLSDTTNGVDVIHAYDATTGVAILPDIPLLGVTGLAIGPGGDLFAVSNNPSQVYRYNSTTGAQIGGPFVPFTGQNDGHDVQGPEGMAFASNGNLFIADVTLSNVHVYDTGGNSVASLDATVTTPPLSQPTDVAFDTFGNAYTVSGSADILQSLGGTQPFTEFVAQQAGGLTIPQSLTLGPDGKLYVLDATGSGGPAIRRYTAAGADDGTFISYATVDFQPNDIAFGPDGKLYVSGLDLDFAVGQVRRYLADGTADGMLVASGPTYPTFLAFSNNVPEPASITLLAIASIGLLAVVRRRRSS
jgi:WD40 repeat protein